jgi:PadR family transcriptional regulator, regulatory protein PadR
LHSEPTSLLQGTLDLLILESLVAGELHRSGMSRRIQQVTGGTFVVKPGSLFPALHEWKKKVGFPLFGQTPKTIAARNTTA